MKINKTTNRFAMQKVNMKSVLSSIIVVLTIQTLQAQEMRKTPRLMVGITIDQLRGDYLEAFYDAFGENGFKRLFREGLVYRNVSFDFENPDASSSIASIYTGTNPDYHGIMGNTWYDYKEKKNVFSTYDAAFMGYATDESTSPKRLLVSTIADELEHESGGKADIFSIAPDKEAAILAGGRSATAAFWIQDYTGKWASSTYYGDLPWWFTKYAEKSSLNDRIGGLQWKPLVPIDNYTLAQEQPEDFTHAIGDGQYIQFKNSPFVNTEINALVSECFEYGAIGKRGVTDLLLITYSARNYQQMSMKIFPVEMMDVYLRLDKAIEQLLQTIDKNVGLDNVALFLTSTGYVDYKDPIDLKEDKTINGEFKLDRCVSLLNMYLMALYGKETWVESATKDQIFLNRKLIEEKKIDLREMQDKATAFLMDFAGIQNVFPSYKLVGGGEGETLAHLKKGYYYKYVGDLFYEIQPGWILNIPDSQLQVVRKDAFNFPLIFFGSGIVAEQVVRPVSTSEIAPTVARIMRIRSPNAAMALPAYEIMKNNKIVK